MYYLTGLMGVVAIVAPYLFNYNNTAVTWMSVLGGVALVILSALEGVSEDHQRWEYVTMAVLGAGAVLAPFVFGFTAITAALWMSIGIGMITLGTAGVKIWRGGLR